MADEQRTSYECVLKFYRSVMPRCDRVEGITFKFLLRLGPFLHPEVCCHSLDDDCQVTLTMLTTKYAAS